MSDSVIDLARTAALGDPATETGRAALVEIFRVYFDNVAVACADMRSATSPEAVRAHAHRARGASGIVGAKALTMVFADLEARAAAGETVPNEVYDDIDRQLVGLRRVVAARLGEDLP